MPFAKLKDVCLSWLRGVFWITFHDHGFHQMASCFGLLSQQAGQRPLNHMLIQGPVTLVSWMVYHHQHVDFPCLPNGWSRWKAKDSESPGLRQWHCLFVGLRSAGRVLFSFQAGNGGRAGDSQLIYDHGTSMALYIFPFCVKSNYLYLLNGGNCVVWVEDVQVLEMLRWPASQDLKPSTRQAFLNTTDATFELLNQWLVGGQCWWFTLLAIPY